MTDDVEARLATHEAVCAERYDQIKMRLGRLEGGLVAGGGAIILLLMGVIISVLLKH